MTDTQDGQQHDKDERHKTEAMTRTGEGGTDMETDAGEDDGGLETEGDRDVKDEQKPTGK